MSGHASCHHTAYRLTCADYDYLLQRSGGKCEICGTPAAGTPRGFLGIDHDVRYGYFAVRGLLCDECNSLMRYVDRRLKPADDRTRRYTANAWFIGVLVERHQRTLKRAPSRPALALPERPPLRES